MPRLEVKQIPKTSLYQPILVFFLVSSNPPKFNIDLSKLHMAQFDKLLSCNRSLNGA